MGKTVYVLGAGFSKDAGFPLQHELLKTVLGESLDEIRSLTGDILSAPVPAAIDLEPLRRDRAIINDLVDTAFPTHEVPLEDVFTLLEQAIESHAHFAKYPEEKLRNIRAAWIRAILFTLHQRADEHVASAELRYKALAAKWVEQRLVAGQAADPFSIVSLNWDGLVEDSIFWVLRQTGGLHRGRALADIDYCVYTHAFDDCPHMPSTRQKAAGIFNIKILKLHGSATWLRCPCSNHVYTGLGSPRSAHELYVTKQTSPFIARHLDHRETESPVLEPYIITPSFTKVFDQPHIQTTWHNAFVELREADEVVFIGYSLPEADYHFRTLLRRAIRLSTRVQVVLRDTDDPTKRADNSDLKALPQYRYLQVFPKERISFNYDGLATFAELFAPVSKLDVVLDGLRARFAQLASQQTNTAWESPGEEQSNGSAPPTV